MSFKTENRKIKDIFDRNCIYSVPRYQREYVWNETNWSELISDIEFTLSVDHNNESLEWSHFLGTIVLNSKSIRELGLEYYEIVDGQQRLTTIFVLLLALHKLFITRSKDNNDAENRANYIYNSFIVSLSSNSKNEIKVENKDMKLDIDNLVQIVKEKNEFPLKNNKFYSCFKYFYDSLEKKSFEDLDRFLKKMLSINIVEIISDQDEEIYNIFEVLNARGQKLKQMELLKNHIMKYVQPRDPGFVDEAKRKWGDILENSKHLSDVDDLIVHFSKCYFNKSAKNSGAVYKLIKQEVPIEELSKFLDHFKEYSKWYKVVTLKPNASNDIQYFDIKANKQIRSLLGAIKDSVCRLNIDEQIELDTVKSLRNFFFIFNVCNFTSNKTEKLIKIAAYEIYWAKSCIDYKYIVSELLVNLSLLLKGVDPKDRILSNQSLKYSHKNSAYYRNSSLVKYILFNLYKEEHENSDTILDFSSLTIEHLLPDDGSDSTVMLKNLTLTTSSINSEDLGNKSISEKIQILNNKSSIIANKKLENYMFKGEFNFTLREEELSEKLINVIFAFHENIFDIDVNDIKRYFNMKKLFMASENEKLLNVLVEKGKCFEIYLNSAPEAKVLKDEYDKLICD